MTNETPMRERIALAISKELDSDNSLESFFPMADAVLDALREPTEQMTKAARGSGIYDPRVFMFAWSLAIDAAKEGK